ncbi:hypothetical protein [Duncaniella muris]|jgi:uncharacterized protein involved in cysteine biosynthesis|uniref:hypothetical protein n=1 Tax=Duncaniella muris TaxID=2094150 RepID=UPI003F66C878
MIIPIIKALAVVLILAVMILILVSVNHYIGGSFNSQQSDVDELRDDLGTYKGVITDKNVLSELVKVRVRPWEEARDNKGE